jgi:hypothetical protein
VSPAQHTEQSLGPAGYALGLARRRQEHALTRPANGDEPRDALPDRVLGALDQRHLTRLTSIG